MRAVNVIVTMFTYESLKKRIANKIITLPYIKTSLKKLSKRKLQRDTYLVDGLPDPEAECLHVEAAAFLERLVEGREH
jgi:hypothetical protein